MNKVLRGPEDRAAPSASGEKTSVGGDIGAV